MVSLRRTALSDLVDVFKVNLRLTLCSVFNGSFGRPSRAPTFSPRTPVRPRLRQLQASGTAASAPRLFLSMGGVFFDFSGGVGDHRRNLLGVRFVHGVAGALDF